MQFRSLGASGLQVSLVGLGTNRFGRRCDPEQSAAIVNRALDLGINFIDTADVYANGLSEEYLGKAIRGRRREAIIATKFAMPLEEGPLWSGASRRYIMEAVQASLRRLGMDYIDLYQVHWWDPKTPIEETMRALDDLVRRGDVRYIGCSNFSAWQVVEAHWAARTEHLNPFIAAQNYYNLLDRSVEGDLAPVCQKYGLGVIPYFPLAGGFLTGKYRPGEPPPEGSRLALEGRLPRVALDEGNFAKLAKLERFSQARSHTIAELALAWLAAQPHVASVIAGATQVQQVEENVRAAEWTLTTADLEELGQALED